MLDSNFRKNTYFKFISNIEKLETNDFIEMSASKNGIVL